MFCRYDKFYILCIRRERYLKVKCIGSIGSTHEIERKLVSIINICAWRVGSARALNRQIGCGG
jgi:hypothetical protein